ncbi:helix-turn-helix transcriptional regulator [Candidatus Bathyarchaeota archaeon]|nr:helix-turn-helix transcriptional regulator [Candidatus Bathyarchaeota archaeon]
MTKNKSMIPFGNKKLYEILTELEREGLIKKLKKKRKVYYIAEEEAY